MTSKKIKSNKVKENVEPKTEEEVTEEPESKKSDKRSLSSAKNAEKARITKIIKAKEKKKQQEEKIKNNLKPVFASKPEIEEESDDEVLLINPPPIDHEKQMKKADLHNKLLQIYEHIRHEKERKASKIRPQPAAPTPVVINMTNPKQASEQDEKLKANLLSHLNPEGKHINFN